ncbi:MAG: 2-oxo acid dehydrogenase subunit E2 [Chloroflexi bacterium]|nr:2-oxo acid dehydrogenase subunit E2 [Chloroflexota bacterium]MCL5273723.1 2-oxo acid dehydrogenase subunit E2 [Chloroflexota bacterium]
MATNVIMPALGIAQETGKLLQWLKTEGQMVTKGEVLMVVETDKTTVEIEAGASGILSQVSAQVGQDVPVGQVIALIAEPGESLPIKTQPHVQTAPAESPILSSESPRGKGSVEASPLARRIAEENHIDLSKVKPGGGRIEKADVVAYIEKLIKMPGARLSAASPKARQAAQERGVKLVDIPGSGPEGAVLFADVMASAKTMPAAAIETTAPGEIIKPGTVWRIMAERTTQSWTTVPHFYLSREANASRLITWRERAQKRMSEKITYTDLIVRLVAAALLEHPRVNAMWKDGAIHVNPDVNIGLAVAIADGLVVPVIHGTQNMNIAAIARQRNDLVARAQNGKLKPDDISGGTFTISNLGMFGIDSFNAIVNAPQAAILAVGRIVERVVPHDGRPAIQSMMTLTLSCDHRAVDGARGAQFLQTLAEMIEEPLGLLD